MDTSDQWIRERTGVLRRHIAEKETTVSMGAEAARQAIKESGISSDEVDLIIAATSTPDQIFPCTACEIQKKLELYQAAGFDLNAACSGFLFAYQTAQAYISSGIYKNILVVGSERLSRIVDWKDRGNLYSFRETGAGGCDAVRPGRQELCFLCPVRRTGRRGSDLSGSEKQSE